MRIRESKEYLKMSFDDMLKLTHADPASKEEQLAFWQKTVDTGMAWHAWQIGGFYGRTAMAMIEDGVIEPA